MARLVLKNVPPGFTDEQVVQEFAQVAELVQEVTVSHKKSFLSYPTADQHGAPLHAARPRLPHPPRRTCRPQTARTGQEQAALRFHRKRSAGIPAPWRPPRRLRSNRPSTSDSRPQNRCGRTSSKTPTSSQTPTRSSSSRCETPLRSTCLRETRLSESPARPVASAEQMKRRS